MDKKLITQYGYQILRDKRAQLFQRIELKKADENEQKLKNFFQSLKKYDKSKPDENSYMGEEAFKILKENILYSNQKFEKFFQKRGGAGLEQRLDRLFQGVAKSISVEGQKTTTTRIGNISNATNIVTKEIFDEIVKSDITRKYLLQQNELTDKFFLPKVQQKVDNDFTSLNITIDAQANQELKEIYSLLSKCRFQAKNYAPLTYNFKEKRMTTWKGTYNITFGNSNYRFFNSVLNYLNTKTDTIDSLYKYAINNYMNNKKLSRIIWNFKQVYEITGIGAINFNSGQNLKTVNYIIFNDPSSDFITVKATSTLLYELIHSSKIPENPFTAEVIASKELFGQQLNDIKV